MTDLQYWKSLPKFKDIPTSYARLVAMYPPRPIHNEAERKKATAILDVMAGHALNRDQDDFLDLISTLLSEYEDEHHPVRVGKFSPMEALSYLLEENGMSASDLGRLLGSRDLGAKILRGERGLSLNHVAILAERFAVQAELFIPAAGKVRKPAAVRGQTKVSWRNGNGIRTI